jgi:hypothetical protein
LGREGVKGRGGEGIREWTSVEKGRGREGGKGRGGWGGEGREWERERDIGPPQPKASLHSNLAMSHEYSTELDLVNFHYSLGLTDVRVIILSMISLAGQNWSVCKTFSVQ